MTHDDEARIRQIVQAAVRVELDWHRDTEPWKLAVAVCVGLLLGHVLLYLTTRLGIF